MGVSVEETGTAGRRLTITIPGEKIESRVGEQLKSLAREAKIKGFRPGKAPAKIVRNRYGAAVRDDVLSELKRDHYIKAVTSESLEPVALPQFEEGRFAEDGDFVFAANLEVVPVVDPQGVDRLALKRPGVQITAADIDTVMGRLQKQNGEWVEVDRPARKGDRLTVNFEGLVDGEPFEGNRGENVHLELGAGKMIPGFEEGLEGIHPGATRRLRLRFPDDYQASERAGKTADFEVIATALEEQRLPELDDALAASLGCGEGLAQLRERVRENMESELAARIGEDLREQVGKQLIDANPFAVPQTLVDREIERRQRQMLRRLGLGEDPSKVPSLPREPYAEASERQVRLSLLLKALIEREAFKADPERVEKHLQSLCTQLDDPARGARELRADDKAMRNIEALVLEDMAYDWLIEQATVRDEPRDFMRYMESAEPGTGKQTENANDE